MQFQNQHNEKIMTLMLAVNTCRKGEAFGDRPWEVPKECDALRGRLPSRQRGAAPRREGRSLSVWIPRQPLHSCVTLSRLLTLSGLQLLTYKTELLVPTRKEWARKFTLF